MSPTMNDDVRSRSLCVFAGSSPGNDPVSSSEITVGNLFGISAPKVVGFNATLSNNLRDRYKFGSADPISEGFGIFDFMGTVQLYFSQLSDYSTFATRQTGATLDITFGSVTNFKDELVAGACDVWNPDVGDPGQSGDHLAMNVAIQPRRCAIALVKVLNSAALSAAASAESTPIAASTTPAPVSVCKPSSVKSMRRQVSISS